MDTVLKMTELKPLNSILVRSGDPSRRLAVPEVVARGFTPVSQSEDYSKF